MKKFALRSLVAAAALAAASSTFAATDGTAGPSSSNGNFDITLTVATQIITTNFDDMDLDTASATLGNPIVGYEDICVGGIGFAEYSVDLTSQNGSSGGTGSAPFQLNGTSQNLAYTAAFIDDIAATTGAQADATGEVAGTYPRVSNVACGSDNARVIVSIASSEWESATETGDYTDTLTVTVTAE
uniref:hypothetical protein n=1 Tax=Microbulbifer agarilyticus TaxID=260552 RepID=UPI0002557F4D|nr:hypothetical protein [Microbulbifer agarilyticus]